MKKLLLSLAMILGMAPVVSVNAATEPTLTQEWLWGGEGWGDGWDGTAPNWSSTDAIKSKACTRFATAKDGKVYLLNMKTMSIAQVTADGVQDLYKLPSLEGKSMNDIPDYYGTAITMDQAGNFLVGHFFTKTPQTVLRYTLYSPSQDKAKTFDLNVPEGMSLKRMDCMGRVLGDMTKKAYAYIAPGSFTAEGTHGTNQKVRVLTFTGDGDVDNVTLSDEFSGMVYLGANNSWAIAQPIYASMEAAAGIPATSTFISASAGINTNTKLPSATYFGFTAAGVENWGYSGLGAKASTALNGFDTFKLGDKTFYALNYLETFEAEKQSPMSVAIFDAAFEYVTSWTNPDYTSASGYATIIAEPIDENTANIYLFNSTNAVDGVKKDYGCAAQLKFSLTGEAQGDNVLFADDFEWLEPWASITPAGQTVETNNPDAKAQQLGTNKVEIDGVEVSTYDALLAKGYLFPVCCASGQTPREAKAQTYLQRNYIKFGLTGFYSGIVLPALKDVPRGANAAISFDWCSMRQGSGKWDDTELVVIVQNGDDEQQFLVPTHAYVNDEEYAWLPVTVDLAGAKITDGTRIIIRNIDEQWPDTSSSKGRALRFFLDNIKVYVTSIAPEGTQNNPYAISTPEDLGQMYAKIAANTAEKTYFTLENDIDMAGVTDYKPAIGSDGATYQGSFDFDGKNHVIKNFAPEAKYSYMSIFGVIRGDVRNLGVENCEVVSNSLGAGALGGYGSQGGFDCVIENVWATGSVVCNGAYAGGLVGTNGNNLTLKNCYFNGDVLGSYAGGLVGRARAGVTIENCYAAGEVAGITNAGGIAGTDKTGLDLTLSNVVAWNTSVVAGTSAAAVTTLNYAADQVKVWDGMAVNGSAVTDGVSAEDLTATVLAWEGWHANLKDGYPALAWENVKGPLGSEDNPFVIATIEDLNGLKAQLSLETPNYVVLEADLDMTGETWHPLYPKKDAGVPTIHFDGKNHVISNLTMQEASASVFGYFTGSIKNFGLENVDVDGIANTWSPCGPFASYALNEVTVENCFVTGSVKGFYAGGIIGGVDNDSKLTMKNCYAIADVNSANGYAGGLVAPCNKNAVLTIENSYTAGTVVAANNAGGISAGCNTTAGWHEGTVINLKNVVTFCTEVKANSAAAIVANPTMDGVTFNIENAKVSAETAVNGVAVEDGLGKYELIAEVVAWEGWNEKLVAGMPGLAWQEGTQTLVTISTADELVALKDKKGDLLAVLLNDIDMEGKTHAISGAFNGTFDGQYHVIKNLNATGGSRNSLLGDVTGVVKNVGLENMNILDGSGWGLAGGLMAYAVGEVTVENCFTTGTVDGYYAAGIVGGVQEKAHLTIRNCYSTANVTSAKGHAGGVVGAINPNGSVDAENCYASGTIVGTVTAGGVFAGAKTYLVTEPTTANLTNVAALNPSVKCNIAGAIIAPFEHLTVNLTNGYVSTATLVNDAAVEGAVSASDIINTIVGWDGFNEKLSNGMPVLAWQDANEDVVEMGTAENPYKLSTPADLCAMNTKMVDGKRTYFVLENDIDMDGVTDYKPAIGSDGSTFIGEIDFDGQNHVIKNFAPDAKYYYMSLFGVLRGNVRNLGVENCEVKSELFGAGVLGGYGGHGGIATTIDNVWATGSVVCTTAYAGGLVGTNGADLTITNSYFNGEVEGTIAGGLVGRARAGVTIENAYAAGTVEGTTNAGGIAGTDKDNTVSITLNNVLAWNSEVNAASEGGAYAVTKLAYDEATVKVLDTMKVNDAVVAGGVTVKELQTIATGWEAYADYTVGGMPILKWQEGTPDKPDAIEGVSVNAAEAPVYYNLQGFRVENPTTGIYIVKRGNVVSKVVIR